MTFVVQAPSLQGVLEPKKDGDLQMSVLFIHILHDVSK